MVTITSHLKLFRGLTLRRSSCRTSTLFNPTFTTLLTPVRVHSKNDSRVYFLIVLRTDYLLALLDVSYRGAVHISRWVNDWFTDRRRRTSDGEKKTASATELLSIASVCSSVDALDSGSSSRWLLASHSSSRLLCLTGNSPPELRHSGRLCLSIITRERKRTAVNDEDGRVMRLEVMLLLLLALAWCWDAKLYRYWSIGWLIIGRLTHSLFHVIYFICVHSSIPIRNKLAREHANRSSGVL